MSLKSIGTLSTVLEEIAVTGQTSAESINMTKVALEKMSAAQVATAISASGLDAAQIANTLSASNLEKKEIAAMLALMGYSKEAAIAALTTDTFSREQAEAAVSSYTFATAQGVAAGATATLSTTLKGLWAVISANPYLFVGALLLALLPKIINLVKDLYKSTEELIEIGNEAFDLVTEKTEKITNQTKGVEELAESYANLAAGVDKLSNKNISLSDEDYKEYLDISNQLAELFPNLISGTDEFGNYILDLSGNYETVSGTLKEYIELEKQRAAITARDNGDDIFKGAQASAKSTQQKTAPLNNQLNSAQKLISFLDDFNGTLDQSSKEYSDFVRTLNSLDLDIKPQFTVVPGSYAAGGGKKVSLDNADEIREALKLSIAPIQTEINSYEQQIKTAWSNLRQTLKTAILDNNVYKELSDDQRSLLQRIIDNLDYTALDFKNWDETYDYIIKNVVNSFSDSGELNNIDIPFNLSIDFNQDNISIGEYREKLQKFFAQLDEAVNNGLLDNDVVIAIKAIFDFDSALNPNDIATKIVSKFKSATPKMKAEITKTLNSLTSSELNSFLSFVNDFDFSNVQTWDEVLNKYNTTQKETVETAKELKEVISSFSDAADNVKDIVSALNSFQSNGFVSFGDLNNLSEVFGDLNSFDNFIRIMGDSASSMEEAQSACNKLVEEYIEAIGILDELNESNAGLIETVLTEMGVINSHELVQEQLNIIQLENVLAANNLADATWTDIEAFLTENGTLEKSINALKLYRQEQYNAALMATDLATATSSTIEALIMQAKAAGVAANKISALQTLKNLIEGGYEKYAGSGLTEEGWGPFLENAARAAQLELSEIESIFSASIDIKSISNRSSGSTSKAKSSLDEQIKELEDKFEKTLSGLEHQIFLLEKEGVAGISKAALTGLREALDEYQFELQEATEKGFDISKTVYGNIDTNNRQILEWTEDNLNRFKDALTSWDTTVDEMRGSISTVFGGSEDFDGIEIAFSPILQTANGPVLLDSNTVREYIWGLIDKAGEGWTNEQLLQLDTKGLEFDGRVIKNLLADIGDTAIQTGEAMHYVGDLGSIQQAYKELENLSNSVGLSAQELSQAILDNDFSDSMTHTASRTANRIVSIYQQMQDAVSKQEKLYRSMGLDDNSEYIQNLQKQWWEYKDNIKEVIAESCDYILKEHENVISVNENLLSHAIDVNNLGDILKYTSDITNHYREMQETVRQQVNYYRSLGYSETSDEISELTALWWEYYDEIKNTAANAWQQIVDNAHDAIDEITGLYDTLKDAAQEFAENGYITVATFQEIAKLGVENLAYLEDENGLLTINEENIQKVIAARTEQMAIETSLSYIQQLRQALTENDTSALMRLTTATDQAARSTWDLVYAQLKLLGLDNQQYDNALKRINALRSLSDVAITSIGKVDGAAKQAMEDQLSALDDLLKYVEEMIKQEVENQVQALEDQVDAYKEIVDLQKKSLELEKDKADYTKTVKDKQKEIADLRKQIYALELDDSREATSKKAQLQEELAEKLNDLADYQADHAYDAATDMLDDMADSYEKEKQKEIDILENTISSEEKLYQLAIDRINNYWDTLYQDLINWNYEYGSVTNDEITKAWEAASAAVQEYGSYLNAIMETQQKIASFDSDTGFTVVGPSGDYDTSGGQDFTAAGNIIKEMYNNMNEHGGSTSSTPAERKAELSKRNLELGEQLHRYGINAYRSTDAEDYGTWYTDSSKKIKLFEKYAEFVYHNGGVAGDKPTLEQKELMAKLEEGEMILSKDQQQPLFKVLDFNETLLAKYGQLSNIISGNDSMIKELQEKIRDDNKQTQFVVEQGGDNYNVTAPIQVYSLQKLDDSEVRKLTNDISQYTISEINDAFAKRGKKAIGATLKP